LSLSAEKDKNLSDNELYLAKF